MIIITTQKHRHKYSQRNKQCGDLICVCGEHKYLEICFCKDFLKKNVSKDIVYKIISKAKPINLTKRERALLSLIISGVKSEIPNGTKAIEVYVQTWIDANDIVIGDVNVITE